MPISTLFTVTVTVTKLFEGSLKSVMEVSAWSRRSSLFLLDLVGESAWGRAWPRTPSSSSLPPSSSSSGEWRVSCWMMISTGILLQKNYSNIYWRFEKPEAHMEPDPKNYTDGFTIIPKPYYVNIKHAHCKFTSGGGRRPATDLSVWGWHSFIHLWELQSWKLISLAF